MSIVLIFNEVETLLNIEAKLSPTGGTRLIMFLAIFFGWFMLLFKQQSEFRWFRN